jgi:hypothetical protein
MLAVDLTRLPVGRDRTEPVSKETVEHLVECFYMQDPKLRGFGAVTTVKQAPDAQPEYRLICGLGIKTAHIWRFKEGVEEGGQPLWECVFHCPSNGVR